MYICIVSTLVVPIGGGGPSASLQVEYLSDSSSSLDGLRFRLTVAMMGLMNVEEFPGGWAISSMSFIFKK